MQKLAPLVFILFACVGVITVLMARKGEYKTAPSNASLGIQNLSPDDQAGANSNGVRLTTTQSGRTSIETYLDLVRNPSPAVHAQNLQKIKADFVEGEEILLLESARFTRQARTRKTIFTILSSKTGQSFGKDYDRWFKWIWDQRKPPHPNYADFKAALYARIDPRFAEYFSSSFESTIHLDEVRWGGVLQDGIPPLKDPTTIAANKATYLADSNVVFGVYVGGQARAYPKRILAWHEMVKDVVGGVSINGVYCTLCGSMIVYDTHIGDKHYELGTSGFLYRSNKLMYDHETNSMWSTLRGEPVIGRLVGKGLKLQPLSVVTTTWGEWKKLHPDTDVLSLSTGHTRDYGEGAAYRDYFATDELMFTVPKIDTRLKNKNEVLIIRGGLEFPVAIASDFLVRHRVHAETINGVNYTVLTDDAGANRVYKTGDLRVEQWIDDSTVQSADGRQWKITEDALRHMESKTVLPRAPAHRAFWFGWHAGFPQTKLIK
ncbi:MAG: DUF3179 domain-containing protein [Planctomycetota bacterium]